MTDPYTDYDRGMQKLFGLFDPGPAPDLRTDPAFAWRVAERIHDLDRRHGAHYAFAPSLDMPLSDWLYTFVCELGRRG